MQLIKDVETFPADLRDCAIAIGNFDGLHRGHRAVIAAMARDAKAIGISTIGLLTFEPHPRSLFRPEVPVFRLSPSPVRQDLASVIGMDFVVELDFNRELAGLEAETFIHCILIDGLGVQLVATGYNFQFGRGRTGDPTVLKQYGTDHGFRTLAVKPFLSAGEAPVSSSAIRDSLRSGDIETATALLGYRWFVTSAIQHGEKRGRELGFPTANMRLEHGCDLAYGVYAVRMSVDGDIRDGVASYGRRPQFDNGAPLLETYLFDFDGDLYDKTVSVEFVAHLRPEARFDNVDALIEQMNRDSMAAREHLAGMAKSAFGSAGLAQ